MKKEMRNAEVMEKAKVARQWCEHASRHAEKRGGKPWTYSLIVDEVIQSNMSLASLMR